MYVAIFIFLRLTGPMQVVDHAAIYDTRQECEADTQEAVATMREALVPDRIKDVVARCVRLDQRFQTK